MKYIKQLDTIRTIAVILVIISHWVPNYYVDLFGFGYVGVDIFFVLSGFLITRILLENKKEAEEKGYNKLGVIKNFIIRRTLRIFPIYYITITILFILGPRTGTAIRADFASYLTYTSNFLFFFKQEWDGMLSHLWSLGVEEQFYLLWPWIMIFVKRKHLFKTIVLFFIIGVSSNYLFGTLDTKAELIPILTPTCFDSFSLGAILSYIMVYDKEKLNVFSRYLSYLALISFIVFIGGALLKINVIIPARTLVSICGLYAIVFAITKQDSIIHKVLLNNPVLIFIGKISYGVYLYHNIIPWWHWSGFIRRIDEANIQFLFINSHDVAIFMGKFLFLEKLVILIFISWVSWKLIESPINGLKRRFEYKEKSV